VAHVIDRTWRKLEAGERLSEEDALALFESPELTAIGELADHANRLKNRDVVFYNVNRHINPTNICSLSCKFCAYSRKPGEEGGYAYSIDEMVAKAGEAVQSGATEVHMVGGLHPRWKYDYYRDMIAAIKRAFPELHLKAFTAVELDWLARKARKSIREVLEELREAGLGSLPGGGAEIFHPEIRDAICDTKVSAEQWLDTHRTAHAMGMKSNCTMLYGHIEKYPHRVDHMRRLRELQDETKGFNAFIPLSFQPFQNEMGIDRYTFGYDDLKTVAIARLFLDNFQHVKAYWVMLGQDVAQLALQFGANDLDGTIVEEKISRMAGGRAGMAMSRTFLESLIRKAGRVPCERDTLYNPVHPPEVLPPRAAEVTPLPTAADRAGRVGELVRLARHATLHELGKIAEEHQEGDGSASCAPTVTIPFARFSTPGEAVQQATASLAACRETYKLMPTAITVDLAAAGPGGGDAEADGEAHDLGLLLEAIFALRHSFPGVHLTLAGIKSLWRLAQRAEVEVGEVLERLSAAGVDQIEGSPAETEADLTHAEAILLHRRVHLSDIGSVARVELTAPSHWASGRDGGSSPHGKGPAEPMWDSFVRRALAFADLHDETGGLIGLSVEVSQGSFVSATEYLRAVAIARLAAGRIPLVIAPLSQIPTVSPAQGLGTTATQHPAEKFAAVALHFGADDLGPVDPARLSPVAIMQQIRSAGFAPRLRGAPLEEAAKDGILAREVEAIRHRPTLTSAL
jgi:aminodeoxyfutalosine synthase